MIASCPPAAQLDSLVAQYLDTLKDKGFEGDLDGRFDSRLTLATDNSIYQALPQAILFPKNKKDIELALQLASQDPFLGLKFGPRGGGTGTNGQSLTHGIVMDLSRHMRGILELNLEEGWVRVEAGVIKDQLNDFLRPHGYFFAPDLSTSNRATIGGMVNTDASGQGSLVYGKTSDHVLGLETCLMSGHWLSSQSMPVENAELIAKQASPVGKLYQTVLTECREKRDEILATFPRLNRFLTGYDLEHVFNQDMTEFDIGRVITGSEGTLGVVAEAKLNITPLAPHKCLINIKYDSFESALRHSPSLVEAKATSVETVDSKVLNLAREDIIWHSVKDLIESVPGKDMLGLNMVEFNGVNADDFESKVNELCDTLDHAIENQQHGVIGYQLTYDKSDILRIYAMRKKAVGLLGNIKGSQKPIAFAEDTAVPPENLADFIMAFRALLDEHGLQYGMFGHVDAGVLHVRPALDLCDPLQEKLMRSISDEVVALTAKFGGLMWGEHGKGYRSEYGPQFFGERLFESLRKIKTAFDPENRLNPGKICTPINSQESLVSVDDEKRSWHDKQIPISVKTSFTNAMDCNGNGLCFNYDEAAPMCPSYKVSKDRRHSPKGRASLMREWLRLQQENGVDPVKLEADLINNVISGEQHTPTDDDDFSHQVKASLDACLACKACTTACPVSVDVPTFRARFLHLYHSKFKRPAKDYFVANVERMAPILSKLSFLVNPVLSLKPVSYLLEKGLGYVDTPKLSSLATNAKLKRMTQKYNFAELKAFSDEQKANTVILVQDAFTRFYETQLLIDFVTLAKKIGKDVVLLPYTPNGKPQHVKGFLSEFKETARTSAELLNHAHTLGIDLVGLDASTVLCYRDEYQQILESERGEFNVLLVDEWLNKHLDAISTKSKLETPFTLLSHCTEATNLPNSQKHWTAIFAKAGMPLTAKATGCCGMAGTYGHESQNLANSKALYAMSWEKHIKENAEVLATGFSCRCQAKRFSNKPIPHPVSILAKAL